MRVYNRKVLVAGFKEPPFLVQDSIAVHEGRLQPDTPERLRLRAMLHSRKVVRVDVPDEDGAIVKRDYRAFVLPELPPSFKVDSLDQQAAREAADRFERELYNPSLYDDDWKERSAHNIEKAALRNNLQANMLRSTQANDLVDKLKSLVTRPDAPQHQPTAVQVDDDKNTKVKK